MAQRMPLPLTDYCFSEIQIGFTFLVPAYQGSPGKRVIKRVCVTYSYRTIHLLTVASMCYLVLWQLLLLLLHQLSDCSQQAALQVTSSVMHVRNQPGCHLRRTRQDRSV